MKSKWYQYDDFLSFISELSHELKRCGDEYIIDHILEQVDITTLLAEKKDQEAMFLVALLDYLCRVNNRPLIKSLDQFKNMKLEKLTFTDDVELYEKITKDTSLKKEILKAAIPEFIRFNLVIDNVRFAC